MHFQLWLEVEEGVSTAHTHTAEAPALAKALPLVVATELPFFIA